MAKPTILVVDGEEARRREVVHGLASFGYEVVAAADAAEGRRFAAGLSPDVVVASAGLSEGLWPAPPDGADHLLRIVLAGDDAVGVPGAAMIPTAGVTPDAVLRKIRTALIGRELGIGADARFAALEGELAGSAALELVPRLRDAGVTACLVLGGGDLTFEGGEVIAARAGGVRGVKAFVRVTREAAGAFRVVMGSAGAPREISTDVLSLMALALEDHSRQEDAAARLPDLGSRPRLVVGPAFFSTQFSALQQAILGAVQGEDTIRALLERVPEPDGEALEEIARLHELGFIAFDPPVPRVRVVTESAADLPTGLAERLGVAVIPVPVLVGREILNDGVDVKAADVPAMLGKGRSRAPETVPPSKGTFLAVYRAMASRGDVVSLHVSSHLSGAFENARGAAAEASEALRGAHGGEIEVVDSGSASAGLALLTVAAARMARRLLSASEIRSRLEAMAPRVHALFVVEDIDFLAHSSRIKGTHALFGGLLGIKPILGIVNGEVVPVERIRGGANACVRLVEILAGKVATGGPVIACIAHAAAPDVAARMAALLRERLVVAELFESEIGVAVATHVGPGCVGAAVLQPTDEERELLAPGAAAGAEGNGPGPAFATREA